MKKIIGGPVIINGRELSLSKAVRAGDFVFLTGQIPFKNGVVYSGKDASRVFPNPMPSEKLYFKNISYFLSVVTLNLIYPDLMKYFPRPHQ